ncbi:hypothetical protein [Halovivax asiaticus]|nr:hypothetical protein [Halovivax asiaticus]
MIEQVLVYEHDREKAVEQFGAELVDEVETAQEAVKADVKWGL